MTHPTQLFAISRFGRSQFPHFNSIFNHLDNPDLSPILSGLVALSARPLAVLETDFACDSTGFTTNRFVPWYDKKYRAWDKREHDWVKVHLMCGVRTNIVTAVEIHERDASDTKQLPSLLATTAQSFDVREVSADKGYSSVYMVDDPPDRYLGEQRYGEG